MLFSSVLFDKSLVLGESEKLNVSTLLDLKSSNCQPVPFKTVVLLFLSSRVIPPPHHHSHDITVFVRIPDDDDNDGDDE